VEIYVGSITKDSLVPIGLVPGMYNSGESEKCLGITPRSRSQLRSYLVEAALIAIRKIPKCKIITGNIKVKT
jgi:hypothetical protein